MSVVTALIRSEENGTLSFGDYTLDTKAKKDKIEFEGDMYKVKTFKTMTCSYPPIKSAFVILLYNICCLFTSILYRKSKVFVFCSDRKRCFVPKLTA